MTRRRGILGAASLVAATSTAAILEHRFREAPVTDTKSSYDPGTARAIASGASDEGWVHSSGVPWDAEVSRWNLRVIEERAALRGIDLRDTLADLRRRERLARGVVARPLKIISAGDSLTNGFTSADATGYRGYLCDLLDRRDVAAEIGTVATGGATMRMMAPNILAEVAKVRPAVVLLHIGTNDTAQPDLVDWQARLGKLVDDVLAAAPCRVALAKIQIPWPKSIGDVVARSINPAIEAVVGSRKSGGRVVMADMSGWGQEHTFDGIHPLDTGYLRMARVWAQALGDAGWLP